MLGRNSQLLSVFPSLSLTPTCVIDTITPLYNIRHLMSATIITIWIMTQHAYIMRFKAIRSSPIVRLTSYSNDVTHLYLTGVFDRRRLNSRFCSIPRFSGKITWTHGLLYLA